MRESSRSALGDLIIAVRQFEAVMDALMSQPSTVERGKKIATVMNGLTMAADSALYNGLGFDFRKDKKDHPKNLLDIRKWSRKREGCARGGTPQA